MDQRRARVSYQGSRAGIGRQCAGQRCEQCRPAGAAGADDAETRRRIVGVFGTANSGSAMLAKEPASATAAPRPLRDRPTSDSSGHSGTPGGGRLFFGGSLSDRRSVVSYASTQSPESASAPLAEVWSPGLEALAQVALPDFLLRQRWYPAKDAGRPAVALSSLFPFPVSGVPAAVAVWRVMPPGQAPLLLFVPLALVPAEAADPAQVVAALPADISHGCGEVRLVEAFSVDAFVRAWIATLLQDDGEVSRAGWLRTGRTGQQLQRAGLGPSGGWTIRRSSAEQSNTSIRIGDGTILKVLRKLEDGIHPELEIGRFLTETGGFSATPSLLAWAELDGSADAGAVTLCILQAFVPNKGDGWSWVLQQLSRVAAPGEDGNKALGEATSWLRLLGWRTAEMHITFATDTHDPAFRPEPVQANDLQGWTASAQAMARRALDGLANAGAQLEPEARTLAEALLARRDEM